MEDAKLIFTQRLEEQAEKLRAYEEQDDIEFPRWSLLLKDVVKAYGICPYHNVHDPDCKARRGSWIASQIDRGRAYANAFTAVTDPAVIENVELHIAGSMCGIEDVLVYQGK